MLTGELPFVASDPMEWVHCHVARQPAPPGERFAGVPAPLSAIAMKLLAKNAEDHTARHGGFDGSASAKLTGPIPQIAITAGSFWLRMTPS